MPSVVCPTCGEKGRIPAQFIGIRIKCKKCGNSFLVTPPAPKAAVAVESVAAEAVAGSLSAMEPQFDGIAVEELAPGAWSSANAAAAQATTEHDHDHHHAHDESSSSFTATHVDPSAVKHYKLLFQKDKFFDGKFELGRLEEAINHYARQGWVVRAMTTAQVAGFSGGPKEEIVVLLER